MAWRRVKNCDSKSHDFAVHAIKLLSEAQETVDGVTQLVKKEANSVNATACALNALADLGEQAKTVLEYYPQTYIPNRDMPIDVDFEEVFEHDSPKKKHHRHHHSSKRSRRYDSGSSGSGSSNDTWSETSSASCGSGSSYTESGSDTWSESSGSISSYSGSGSSSVSSSCHSGSDSNSGSDSSSDSGRRAYTYEEARHLMLHDERRRVELLSMLQGIHQATGLPIYIPENAPTAALEALLMTCRAIVHGQVVQQQQQRVQVQRPASPSHADLVVARNHAKKRRSCKRQTARDYKRQSYEWDSMCMSPVSSSSSTDSVSSSSSSSSSNPLPPLELIEHLNSLIQQERVKQMLQIKQRSVEIIKENEQAIVQIIGEETVAKMNGSQSEETSTANIWSRISALTGIPIEILQVVLDVEVTVRRRSPVEEKEQEETEDEDEDEDEEMMATPEIVQRLIEEIGQALLSQCEKERESQLVKEVDNLVKKENEEASKPSETAARDMFAPASSDDDDESGDKKAKVTERVDWNSQ